MAVPFSMAGEEKGAGSMDKRFGTSVIGFVNRDLSALTIKPKQLKGGSEAKLREKND